MTKPNPPSIHEKAERVKRIFDPYFEAPVKVWEAFAGYLQPKAFKKNEIIKEVHRKERFLYIIVKGSAGIFLYKENAQPVCLDLCYEHDFFGDYMSLITGEATEIYTQALEPVELWSISRSDLNRLYENSLTGNLIGRIAAESLFVHKQKQQIELLKLTAEERYRLLLEKQPEIIRRTPRKHIASYLGITPESFSRIRKKKE